MASEDYPGAGVIVMMVLAVCFIHYLVPAIHYFCIGACKTQTYPNNDSAETDKGTGKDETNETDIVTIDVAEQYAVTKQEIKEEFKYEKSVSRVLSMHFTLGAYVWIIYFAITSGMTDDDIKKGTRLILNVLGYIHLPVFVLFLWGELFCSWEAEYLGSIKGDNSCKTYLQMLKEQKPVKAMCVGAFHYETRTRTYTYTGANGQLMTGTETYQELVKDHMETLIFPFTRCEDCSADLSTLDLDPGKVTRIKLLKLVLLGDEATKSEFDRLRTEMEEKVKGMFPNSIIEFAEDDGIPLFEDRICAYMEAGDGPWWTNQCLYLLVSFLLLTWFYRIAFRFATQSTCYRVVKKIYI